MTKDKIFRDPHQELPDGSCSCGTRGFLARLSCGCENWFHGEPRAGGYVTCGSLRHQSSYKILEVRPGD